MHQDGIGFKKDIRHAIKFYTASAKEKFSPAKYNLGVIFYYGRGVNEDKKYGLNWIIMAAEQNYCPSFSIIGDYHRQHSEYAEAFANFDKARKFGCGQWWNWLHAKMKS